jgi:hypothetical protein
MDKASLEASLAALDTWIQLFAVIVAIGIVGEVGFGVRHWILNRRLQHIQHSEDQEHQAEIARLNKDAGGARKAAGEALERAGNAEENLAGAHERAARANERAAMAEQNAAEANKKAEEEKLARLKIEEKLAPRSLTQAEIEGITAKLRPLGPQRIDFFIYPNDPEINGIANEVASALQGWAVAGFQPLGGGNVSGMVVEFDPNDRSAEQRARTLVSALAVCRLKVNGPVPSLPTPPNQLPAMLTGNTPVGATIRLTIGKK